MLSIQNITREALMLLTHSLGAWKGDCGFAPESIVTRQWVATVGASEVELSQPYIDQFSLDYLAPAMRHMAALIGPRRKLAYAGLELPRGVDDCTLERLHGIEMRGLMIWNASENFRIAQFDVRGTA